MIRLFLPTDSRVCKHAIIYTHTHMLHTLSQQLSVGLALHPDCEPPENILAWIRGI